MADEMVKETQVWLNKTYKGKTGFTTFTNEELDGVTGQGTFKRLIQALQIELNEVYGKNITVDGSFGNGTLKVLPSQIESGFPHSNIVKIIQGSFWCKGYSAGSIDGVFGNLVKKAVISFEKDAGLDETGIITPVKLQGIMNTDGYRYSGANNTLAYYQHLVQKAMNQKYSSIFGLVAPNGIWERKSHKILIKCCQKEWGISSPDGVWGNNTKSKAPALNIATGTSNPKSTLLLQWALTVNDFYTGAFSGIFDESMSSAVTEFQKFMCLIPESYGAVDQNTWASLLNSKGDTSRRVKGLDTSSKLTEASLKNFITQGITDIGRYLTNANGGKDKALTLEELNAFHNANMHVFPIYQTSGNHEAYFSSNQGLKDAELAKEAAQKLNFPSNTTIYFAVDFDVKTKSIEQCIVPYFRQINSVLKLYYNVGVYGPRAVCNALTEKRLVTSSFVADMSSGFTGNIGQPMPKNWAYEQILETTMNGIDVDKCVVSPRRTGLIWEPKIDYAPVNEDLVAKYEKDLPDVYDAKNHCFYEGTNQLVVYNTLKAAGLGIYALAAFLGNIQAEKFDTALSGHDGSVGICQWRDISNPSAGSNDGLRRTNFFAYAKDCNEQNPESIQFQANFILEECTSTSKYCDSLAIKCFNLLKDSSDIQSTYIASDYVTAFYERPSLCKTIDEINASQYDISRFDIDVANYCNGYYYLDTPKRRGYTEVYYKYLLDMLSAMSI